MSVPTIEPGHEKKYRSISHAEWKVEAENRFGKNQDDWEFICPVCKRISSIKDWRMAKAPMGAIAYSCVGRYDHSEPKCNYAGGGLFQLNPVEVDFGESKQKVFEFAPTAHPATQRKPE